MIDKNSAALNLKFCFNQSNNNVKSILKKFNSSFKIKQNVVIRSSVLKNN